MLIKLFLENPIVCGASILGLILIFLIVSKSKDRKWKEYNKGLDNAYNRGGPKERNKFANSYFGETEKQANDRLWAEEDRNQRSKRSLPKKRG